MIDLKAIEERLKRTTNGPWIDDWLGHTIATDPDRMEEPQDLIVARGVTSNEDRAWITVTHDDDMPALIEETRRLRRSCLILAVTICIQLIFLTTFLYAIYTS